MRDRQQYQPSRMTQKKTDILKSQGHKVIGHVLRMGEDGVTISAEEAVRWIKNVEYWDLMHPKQQQAQSTMLRKPTIITPNDRDMLKTATCFANDGTERDWSAAEPEFDAMNPDQERLAIEFCEEIAGKKGDKPSLPDPVRLLEMAEALYIAERKNSITQQPAQLSNEDISEEQEQQEMREEMQVALDFLRGWQPQAQPDITALQAENADLKQQVADLAKTLNWLIRQVLNSAPMKRDWLDPVYEAEMKESK